MSGHERDRNRSRWRGRSIARGLGAIAGAISVAGCSGADDPETDPSDDGRSADDDDVEPEGSADGDDVDEGGEEFDMTDDECLDETTTLEDDLAAVEAKITRRQDELEPLQADIDRLEIERDVLEPLPDDVLEEAEAVGEAARNAVVLVDVGDGSHGTGWFIDDTYVMTNAHNVAGAVESGTEDDLSIWTLEGEQLGVSVVDYEPEMYPDVALLESTERAPASLDLADSVPPEGEYVVQVGHPGGVGNWIISAGRITSVGLDAIEEDDGSWTRRGVGQRAGGAAAAEETPFMEEEISTDVPGVEGVSGSPLLTLDGEVIGMTYGADADVVERDPGKDFPQPHPEIVYDYHIGPRTDVSHVHLDDIVDRYQAWRS